MKINDKFNDEELVVLAREKDKEYFAFIIDRYEAKMRSYINRLINNPVEAKDLVQETFINAFVNLRNFDESRRFSPWIYRIAHNVAVNWLKRKRAHISIEQNEVIASKLTSKMDLHGETLSREVSEELTEALNRLPEKFKEPLVLKYMEDRSYDEISDILRKPKNTIGTLIKRAKELLKKDLEEKRNYYQHEHEGAIERQK